MAAARTPNTAAFLNVPRSALVLEERPIPSPLGADDILVRNHAVGLNPIDRKRQAWDILVPSYPVLLGSDVAGTVAAVGSAVTGFEVGDRVFASGDALATDDADRAAFQTYTVVSARLAAKIPDAFSFSRAATLPTALGTAAMALFDVLALPRPSASSPPHPSSSILVWGGSSSVGSMTIQLARLSGLTVFAAASPKHHDYLRRLGASVLVDYASPTAVEELVAAADEAGRPIALAVDAISSTETLPLAADVLRRAAKGAAVGKLVYTSPLPPALPAPEGVEAALVLGQQLWSRRIDIGSWLYGDAVPRWLASGELEPFRVRAVEGGVAAFQTGLDLLQKGVSGEKVVVEL